MDAYIKQALALKSQNKFEDAIKIYDKAIQFDPNDSRIYYNKGLCLEKLEKYEEAIENFNKAIGLDSQKSNYYFGKAIVLKQQGKLEDSIKQYNKAIELNPQDPSLYYNKANLLRDLGKYEEALENYNKALKLNPNKAIYYQSKALIFKMQGKYEESLQTINAAIQLDKNDPALYTLKANIYNMQGKLYEAMINYDIAIQYDPLYVLVYANKAALLTKQGKNEDAITCIKICSRLFKEGHKKGLTKKNIDFIQYQINQFEKIEQDNVKIMEKVNSIVGSQKEKQNLQVVAQKFTNLLNKITEQQVTKKIGKNVEESQNNNKIQENDSNELDEIENQQKLINQKLNDQNQTLLQKQQYLEDMLMKMENKLNQQQNSINDLNQNVNQINNDLKDGGLKQKAELNRDLLKLQKDEEKSVFNYYKTFYWSSLNVLQTYRILSTNLISGNSKSDTADFLENNGDKISEGMKVCLEAGKNICKDAITSIPIIGNIFSFIDKSIDVVLSAAQAYSDKKDQENFQNKINAINQLISTRFQSEEDLSIKLALIGIKLTKLRKEAINFPDIKKEQKGSVLSWLSDQISKVEDSHFNKTELHDLSDEGVKLALQDVVLLISYISLYSDRIIKLEKQDIVDILVDIIDKKIDGLSQMELNNQDQEIKNDQITDNNRQRRSLKNGCTCNIF